MKCLIEVVARQLFIYEGEEKHIKEFKEKAEQYPNSEIKCWKLSDG